MGSLAGSTRSTLMDRGVERYTWNSWTSVSKPALSSPFRMVSATAMDAGEPAIWGRLVIVRWKREIESMESWAVYLASASRSWTMDRLEKPSRVCGPAAWTDCWGRQLQAEVNASARAAQAVTAWTRGAALGRTGCVFA